MTREETIKIFNTVLFFGKCDCQKEEAEECIKMAIKALEQEPCEDCISRQDVIDIIDFEDKWLYDAKSHNRNTEISFNSLKSCVKDLPSVVPKTESEE